MITEIDFAPPIKAAAVDDIKPHRTEPRSAIPTEEVFPQSVASGDPSPRGAILWTRIDPDAYVEEISLIVEIAQDERFGENLHQRVVNAEAITPKHDYTVKVDLDESELNLEADHWYYYRFEYNGVTSKIGRCKTLPDEDSSPESVQFAVVSCRDYQNGYYGAYQHIAGEAVDFLVDLGDFIYEVTDGRYALDSEAYPEHGIGTLPSEGGQKTGIVHNLHDYRYLYQTYHSDRFLQTALERHTRIHVWDDHEFTNNIYWDRKTGAPRAPGHPYDKDPDRMERLVRDALQAWWEYTPARVKYDPEAEEVNELIRLYRIFKFGDLFELIVTDERLYRTQPEPSPSRVRNRLRNWLKNRLSTWVPLSAPTEDSDQTMLGEKQREWFIGEIHDSQARWTVWANEVLTLPLAVPLPHYLYEAWDGYESERKQLMQEIKASQMLVSLRGKGPGIRNFVTLTGDMHSYLIGYQRTTYPQNNLVGVELMTPAMTSINIAEAVIEGLRRTGSRIGTTTEFLVSDAMEPLVSAIIPRVISNVEFFNSHEWGYSVVTFSTEHCTYRAYSVDKTKNSAGAERKLITEVRIPEGRTEIQKMV